MLRAILQARRLMRGHLPRRGGSWGLWPAALLGLALYLAGCRAPVALVSSLPPSASTITVYTSASQPFYSAHDGLRGIQLRVNVPTEFLPGQTPALTGGASLRVTYEPDLDPRYPDRDFYAWPESEQWLGELVDGRTIGQTFRSLYPGLNGITLRVSTYGADFSPGTGRLRQGQPAIVREAPFAGREVTVLPGGTEVEVRSAREGWAEVILPDGRRGYVDQDQFASLPPPSRRNTGEVILRLYRLSDGALLRESRLPASTLHDQSHVTFSFEPLPDSYRQEYRFTLTAAGARPGSAVTFRFSPIDVYSEGRRLEGNVETDGDLIFRPAYAERVLVETPLDQALWSGLTGVLEVTFEPTGPTRDCYLRVTIQAGDRPVIVHWSWVRPPGGLPLSSADDPGAPAGGLVLNALYADDVPVLGVLGGLARGYARLFWRDPWLTAAYIAVVAGALAWVVRRARESWSHGR
uniref:SH3 domain-containing protein n=1 Tax=Thermorudis peleae TaxID=1382356 RepID=A0A831X221_9BACT